MPLPFPTAVGSFAISGFGNLSVTSNALLSTMTTVGSGLPSTETLITFHVLTGGAAAYLDPTGATPSTTSGIPIEPGQSVPLILNDATKARIISAGTSAVSAWW